MGPAACDGGRIGVGDQLDMAGGGGEFDMAGGGIDSGPRDRDAACAAVKAEASLVKKPVDIIMVVDNSGSMTQEIQAVQRNININFADILNKSGLDYRVILISNHGKAVPDEDICISKPLSGNDTCDPPAAAPVNGARFFHYDRNVESTDSLSIILSTYNTKDQWNYAPNGWSGWLRPDAVRMFLEITDDNSAMASTAFDSQLLALTPKSFGTAQKRNYIFHTIAGLKENNPATEPWPPTAPIQTAKCTNGGGAVNSGLVYQELSRLTGGLRFPICEHASFDAVFKKIAEGVIEGSKVACEFTVPPAPPGQIVDPNSIIVEYTPGMGAVQPLRRVAGAAQCAPQSFYLSASRIVLCPDTCAVIQADSKAKLDVLFDCLLP